MVVYALLIGKVIPACAPVSILTAHGYCLLASFTHVLPLFQIAVDLEFEWLILSV